MEVEPEPEPEPVTLLVKSPNQRHRDLELSGDRSWSVGLLKAHLSRVYPERPVRGAPDSRCQRLPPRLSSPRPASRPPPLPLQLLSSPSLPRRLVLTRSLPQGWGLALPR